MRADLPALTEIYNHYIETSPVTFDVTRCTADDRLPWFSTFAEAGRYRLFAAVRGHELLGYAGTLPFRPKAAYSTSVEMTIYVAPGETAKGVGRALYAALFQAVASEPIHRAYAGVTLPNPQSLRLHAAFGFVRAGHYHEVGFKLGRYWDVVWLEKTLP